MKNCLILTLVFGVLVISLHISCGGEPFNPFASPAARLIGDWNSTNVLYTNKNNTAQTAMVSLAVAIGVDSASFSINFNSDDTYLMTISITITILGQTQTSTVTETGTYQVERNNIIFTDDKNNTDAIPYWLVGNRLHLVFDDNTTYDFNNDGTIEPATATWVFQKKLI
jgi:hypothetical protein